MKYFGGIDALRFLGAISVVALHLGSLDAMRSVGLGKLHILVSGNTGVVLFYVISGFLITTMIQSEFELTKRFDLLSFFKRRVIRIFPLYYFALSIYIASHLIGLQNINFNSWLFALFYAYNFVPRSLYDGWLGSFHTLATEEHFYLLYPLLWYLALRFRFAIWPVLLALVLLTIPTLALSTAWADAFFVFRWTFNAWGPILIGCCFSLIYWRMRESSATEGALVYLGCFVFLFAGQVVVTNLLTMAVGFGFLILHFVFNQSRLSTRLISGRLARYLGSISYGIYVWQSFIISTGPNRRLIDDPYMAVAAVFLLSVFSWHFIERPLARRRSRPMHPSPV